MRSDFWENATQKSCFLHFRSKNYLHLDAIFKQQTSIAQYLFGSKFQSGILNRYFVQRIEAVYSATFVYLSTVELMNLTQFCFIFSGKRNEQMNTSIVRCYHDVAIDVIVTISNFSKMFDCVLGFFLCRFAQTFHLFHWNNNYLPFFKEFMCEIVIWKVGRNKQKSKNKSQPRHLKLKLCLPLAINCFNYLWK